MKKRLALITGIIVLLTLACNLPTAAPPTASGADTTPDSPVTSPESPTEGSQAEGLPDFIVEILSIESPTVVQAFYPYTWVYYRVTNIGTVAYADDIRMRGASSRPASFGYILVEGPFEPGIPVESSVAVGSDASWELGEHTFYITVDFENQVVESNEENNQSNSITFTVVAP